MTAGHVGEPLLRQAFRQFATGVVLVYARGNGTGVFAAQACAFNSLSLDPPLVLWSLDRAAPGFGDFKSAASFSIHVLADDQEPLLRCAEGPAPDLSGPDWTPHPELGLPIHARSSAWFACANVSQFDAGDHGIFVGEIRDCAFSERRPLVRCAGRYTVPRQVAAA